MVPSAHAVWFVENPMGTRITSPQPRFRKIVNNEVQGVTERGVVDSVLRELSAESQKGKTHA
jgi:hypothetical protein